MSSLKSSHIMQYCNTLEHNMQCDISVSFHLNLYPNFNCSAYDTTTVSLNDMVITLFIMIIILMICLVTNFVREDNMQSQ